MTVPQNPQGASPDLMTKTLLGAIVSVLTWVAYTTQQNSIHIAEQGSELRAIHAQIAGAALDRYTGSQAKADQALTIQRLNRLEQWNQNLSERLRTVENDARQQQRN